MASSMEYDDCLFVRYGSKNSQIVLNFRDSGKEDNVVKIEVISGGQLPKIVFDSLTGILDIFDPKEKLVGIKMEGGRLDRFDIPNDSRNSEIPTQIVILTITLGRKVSVIDFNLERQLNVRVESGIFHQGMLYLFIQVQLGEQTLADVDFDYCFLGLTDEQNQLVSKWEILDPWVSNPVGYIKLRLRIDESDLLALVALNEPVFVHVYRLEERELSGILYVVLSDIVVR